MATRANMVGAIDSRKSTANYMMTFAEGAGYAVQVTEIFSFIYPIRRAHHSSGNLQTRFVVEKISKKIDLELREVCLYVID